MTDLTHNPDHYPHNGGNADTDLLCRACELGVPVKRAMPGPPEHRPNAHPHGDGSDGWCPICHHLHARRPVGSNRLTAAEAAAEYWRAEADEAVHLYTWCDSSFRDEEADDAYAHIRATWRRFKDIPHALEVEA